ncbi:MAG TPA: ATP-dependent DNA helicase [Steroidobacteraceae bacterium]|nr:ATP-dependent DNA helicase [Steroidobacteraceae bacterium]
MLDLHEIFGEKGPLARGLSGFRPRASQLAMARAVATALEARGWLVAEAGTGTGKTFAYLIPALLSGRRVIVSTGTRTLQDQLFHRDLPLLGRVLGRPATVALLKGRANYLCRERWLRLPRELPLDAGTRTLGAVVARWAQATVEGDLAEVPELPDGHPLRERITSTRDSCTAGRCAEYSRCHVFAARRRAGEADLVVVNHHLLLADLALKEEGYGDILPAADAVILDEAHQLPELAAQFFGLQFASRKVDDLLADLPVLLVEGGFDPERVALAADAANLALQRALRAAQAAAPPGQRRAWSEAQVELDREARALVTALCDLADALRDLDAGEGLIQAAMRAGTLAGELDAVLDAPPAAGARLLQSAARGFSCQVVPFDIGPTLRGIMDARPAAWIFTSATLAVAGDFRHFVDRMGIAGRCDTLAIDSPFDYPQQALLYLPPGLPDPATAQHGEAALAAAASLAELSAGGAFLLFTSHRALAQAARLLRERWGTGSSARLLLLVQGEGPREQLLREFREHGDAVLLGTASFWEGVDVPGSALRLVVIDRLPFASPEDPVLRARAQHVRQQGGDPFRDFQVPEAAIALKQGVGRLIRSEADRGVVAILDPRLTGKGYGRQLLAALPPMRRTQDLLEVRQMLTGCMA